MAYQSVLFISEWRSQNAPIVYDSPAMHTSLSIITCVYVCVCVCMRLNAIGLRHPWF